MRKVRLALMMAGAGCLALFAGSTFGQGSLTPPGAPAPTMKTLQEIEPRIPISSAPYTITQPGSYYLATNVTSLGHGVIIQSDCVSLDLMGFVLSGDRGAADYGVYLDGATNAPVRDVVVRNGAIRNFGYGVWCGYGMNCRFEQLTVSSNFYHGVILYGGYSGQCNGNTVIDCAMSGNGDLGIYLYGSYSGQCDGNTIANCVITDNGLYGLYLNGYSGQCDGNTVANCTIRKNVDYGIDLYYADGNRVECNHVSGQTGATTYGIRTSSTAQNLILRNSCVGQTNNYSLSASDTYGPIVTNVGELATSGAAAHPWANFSR